MIVLSLSWDVSSVPFWMDYSIRSSGIFRQSTTVYRRHLETSIQPNLLRTRDLAAHPRHLPNPEIPKDADFTIPRELAYFHLCAPIKLLLCFVVHRDFLNTLALTPNSMRSPQIPDSHSVTKTHVHIEVPCVHSRQPLCPCGGVVVQIRRLLTYPLLTYPLLTK